MKLHFIKMHALGNDFILIDDRFAGRKRLVPGVKNIPQLSRTLCSSRFGIGADQLLLLGVSKKADFKMRIFNADGGEVEMCGNGIRCLAKYIWDNKLRKRNMNKAPDSLSIETIAGIARLQKTGKLIKVDMGMPVFDAKKIPVVTSRSQMNLKNGRVINQPLSINSKIFKITCVSMGNPHTIIVAKDINSVPLNHYGPLIEKHRFFPNRTNVEFIQIVNRDNIKMRVWERGAGETMACGTGASAVCVVSALLELTRRKVTIHLPGGKLLIEWSQKDNHVYMTGPAVTVFEGTIEL